MGALIAAPKEKPHRGFATLSRRVGQVWEYLRWRLLGCRGATPFRAKAAIIRDLARATGAPTLIESGTFCGDMAAALSGEFLHIHSIELSRFFAQQAVLRFRKDAQVQVHHGDSALYLPRLLRDQTLPCIVWLDGHYSSGKVARGLRDQPVLHELTTVFGSPCPDHWVLLDDARRYDGQHDYPTLEAVRTLAQSFGREDVTVVHDIIQIAPPRRSQVQPSARRTA